MSIFIKSSSIWTTPSPSQRPIEPPKSAKNVEKPNSLNPIRFSGMFLLKLITIEDSFFFQDVEAVIVPRVAVDLEIDSIVLINLSKISRYILARCPAFGLCGSIEHIPQCVFKISYILRHSKLCDLARILCDPERSDSQTLCDVPHEACVTFLITAKLLGGIINTGK